MRVTSKGQVTIPKPIRDHLGIKPGSEVEFVEEAGVVRLVAGSVGPDADERRRRAKAIEAWADRVKGTLDLDGMSVDEYFDWIRGPRDDLDPR
jgi:AbrB family looped-hinge helix DNA binding protein